jgi:hypothetical protein
VVSRYRNLLHHFVHQHGNTDASTFWAGCGAIRRAVFEAVGGFDVIRFPRSSIEDIELGYRLRTAGYRIRLDKGLQGTHLKRWTLAAMVRTDVARRAIPWARLVLESGAVLDDLNLSRGQRWSAILLALAGGFLGLSWFRVWFLGLTVACLVGVLILNRKLYAFFYRQHGLRFLAASIPLHLLYFGYSGASYLGVWLAHRVRSRAHRRPLSAGGERRAT